MHVPEGLKVRPDPRRDNLIPLHNPMLVIVTCDIVFGRKIEFPKMWDLYWNDVKKVHPW